MIADATVLVMAKTPRPGRVKTRLCPPCDGHGAAAVAEAALARTLTVVAAAPARRRVVVLDGPAGSWLPHGFAVWPQADGDLGARLADAFGRARGPSLVIGMDTPQILPELLTHGLDLLLAPTVDAVLGPARDGGWWALGLRHPDPAVFAGVPMSSPVTGAAQLARLDALGLRTRRLPELRDVDRADDAHAVAALLPGTRFAATVARFVPAPVATAS
jgi:rSAM/selenodomain-associated transferase 1